MNYEKIWWQAKLEAGVTPTGTKLMAQAKDFTKKRWKALEQNQQEALGSVGLKIGAPPVGADWACPQCQKCFANRQAMRMHEVAIHKAIHIAHAYLPATNCQRSMWEYRTKEKAIRHFKTTNICLPRTRYVCPEGLGYRKETAEGMELARLKSEPRIILVGPLR